jgi:hypothetical protein
MDIDHLASLWQHDFDTIRAEMATRAELRAIEGNILRAIDNLGIQLSQHASRWNDDCERLSDRVQNVENRIGPGG